MIEIADFILRSYCIAAVKDSGIDLSTKDEVIVSILSSDVSVNTSALVPHAHMTTLRWFQHHILRGAYQCYITYSQMRDLIFLPKKYSATPIHSSKKQEAQAVARARLISSAPPARCKRAGLAKTYLSTTTAILYICMVTELPHGWCMAARVGFP